MIRVLPHSSAVRRATLLRRSEDSGRPIGHCGLRRPDAVGLQPKVSWRVASAGRGAQANSAIYDLMVLPNLICLNWGDSTNDRTAPTRYASLPSHRAAAVAVDFLVCLRSYASPSRLIIIIIMPVSSIFRYSQYYELFGVLVIHDGCVPPFFVIPSSPS